MIDLLKPCTEERYDEMLGILPPALNLDYGFLVGEPTTHRLCTRTNKLRPTFPAFFWAYAPDGKSRVHYEFTRSLTPDEFLAVCNTNFSAVQRARVADAILEGIAP